MRQCFTCFAAAMIGAGSGHAADDRGPRFEYEAVADTERVPGRAMTRYFTTDGLGRTVIFYLDDMPETLPPGSVAGSAGLPLVVYVQGSGSQSVFRKKNDRVFLSSGSGPVADGCKGRARFLVVEKPGVQYLNDPKHPGDAREASEEFRKQHTLGNWSEAVHAAIGSAAKLPGVDTSRMLVCGHSEGGLVACRVAAMDPRVTHVASLAGGGVTQLYDLMQLARRGFFCGDEGKAPEVCVQELLDSWKEVLADPESAEKMFLGHPYRRWTSFLASSPVEELGKTKARVFIAQGTADNAVDVSSFDLLQAQLLSRGRDVTAKRVDGADHSFNRTGADGKRIDGWTEIWSEVLGWYLNDSAPTKTAETSDAATKQPAISK